MSTVKILNNEARPINLPLYGKITKGQEPERLPNPPEPLILNPGINILDGEYWAKAKERSDIQNFLTAKMDDNSGRTLWEEDAKGDPFKKVDFKKSIRDLDLPSALAAVKKANEDQLTAWAADETRKEVIKAIADRLSTAT